MKKTIRVLSLVLLMVVFLSACSVAAPVATPVAKDILDENTDAMGVAVQDTLNFTEDSTIVSTAPSITEILYALGVGDQIIGVDINSNYPEAVNDIEKVGDFSGFDVEKVVGLSPDVVFAGNGLQHEQIQALNDAGLNVVSVEPTYYEDIAASIRLIGEQVDKTDEANALIADIDAKAKEITEKGASLSEHPSVYYAMTIGDNGYWTSGQGTFINTIIEMAGGACVTANSEMEWLEYSAEDLIAADPEVLLVSTWVSEEDLLADPVMSELSSVKDGNYFYISDDLINRPGPRIIEAMTLIQGFLMGE